MGQGSIAEEDLGRDEVRFRAAFIQSTIDILGKMRAGTKRLAFWTGIRILAVLTIVIMSIAQERLWMTLVLGLSAGLLSQVTVDVFLKHLNAVHSVEERLTTMCREASCLLEHAQLSTDEHEALATAVDSALSVLDKK